MLQIGFSDWVNAFDAKKDCCIINFQKGSVIKVRGNVRIGPGAEINIGDNAILDLGNQVSINARCHIECHKFIQIGNNTLVSWDCDFMDTDFHHIGDSEVYGSVTIGNDVWICSKCTILKDTYIPVGSVIGAKSLVNRKFTEEHSLYAGSPANLIKSCIKWRR